jgi:hypothetical protein
MVQTLPVRSPRMAPMLVAVCLSLGIGACAGWFLHLGAVSHNSEAREQQLPLLIDERSMRSSYANAFRTNGMAEEVMLDFGLNIVNPAGQQQGQPQVVFQINDRVILNYYSAKRLAIALGQLINRHEQQFGELELDVTKRQKSQ